MKKLLALTALLFILATPAEAAVTFPINGGTGSTTLSGILKGNGTSPVVTALPGIDYLVNITGLLTNGTGIGLSGSGTSGSPYSISNTGVLSIGGLTGAVATSSLGLQPIGNYITALTGDGTASGPGSVALTLATVNSNVGTFTYPSVTVNGKGLVTAISNGTAPTTYTATYPVTLTGSAFGLAFGTTTANSWSALNTFNGGLTIGSLTGTLNATNGVVYSTATSTPTFSTGLTYSGTAGQFIGGTSGSLTVNTTQNISTLSNLTVAGFVQTTSGGVLSSAALTSGQVTTALGFTPGTGTVTSVGLSDANSTLTIGSTPVTTSGTITATLNLAHANTWSALQTFGNASTTNLSVSNAFYGASLSSCNSASNALTWNAGSFGCNTISGSGTVGSGLTGQFPYYASNGTTLTATSTLFLATSGNIGVGTSSPSKLFTVEGNQSGGVARIQRDFPSTPTNTVVGTYDVALNELGSSLVDLTGPGQTFGAMSNSGTEQIQADISSFRDGGDTNGGFEIRTYNAGNPLQAILIDDNQNVAIGTSSVGDLNADKFIVSGNEAVGADYTLATAPTNGLLVEGNTGIGTTSPGTLLSLGNTGGINFSPTATSTFGSSANGINITNGCYAIGGVCITGGGGGTNYFTNSGNSTWLTTGTFLGVGTTTPKYALSISSTAQQDGTIPLEDVASTTNAHIFDVLGNGRVGINSASPLGTLYVKGTTGPTNSFMVASSTGTNEFLIDPAGNIEIGNQSITNNGIGAGSQQVGFSIDTSGRATFAYNSGSATTGSTVQNINGSAGTGAGLILMNGFAASAAIEGITDSSTFGEIAFDVTKAGALTEDLRITSNGSVGIGTSTPFGNYLQENATSTGQNLVLSDASLADPQWALRNAGGILYVGTTSPQTGATSTTGLSIQSTTNTFLGVGTTSPWRTLSVTGTVGMQGLTTAAGTVDGVCINTVTFELEANSSASCTVSSKRFKHDIQAIPSQDGLDALMQLKPSSFIYNGATSTMYGFVAEDVAAVTPATLGSNLVGYDNQGRVNSIDDIGLEAVTVKAIQEQQAEILASKIGHDVEDGWQDIFIGLLILGFLWQQWQIRKLKKTI